MCGPCAVDGIGVVPPYDIGNPGPETSSTVAASASQCALGASKYGVPCDPALGIPAVTNCRPTAPPVLPITPVDLKVLGIETAEDAPYYIAVPVPPPYGAKEYTKAAEVGARAAFWKQGSFLPPDAPVITYGFPPLQGPTIPPTMQMMFGAAPPAVGILGVPPPGFVIGTAPPPAAIKAAKEKNKGASLLSLDQTPVRRMLLRKRVSS